jgi:hypothetical protein
MGTAIELQLLQTGLRSLRDKVRRNSTVRYSFGFDLRSDEKP